MTYAVSCLAFSCFSVTNNEGEKNVKLNQLWKSTTTQGRRLPGSKQIRNHAGGYAWEVDLWTMLNRFLILGSENGTYYVSNKKLTLDNVTNLLRAIKEDGERVVQTIVEISNSGRAPKNDPALFALGLAASFGNDATRRAALAAMPEVCRTGTHLFQFVEVCNANRGWGRALRRAVGDWYNSQDPDQLEYLLVKYQNREGWSHRDLLRLAHPRAKTDQHNRLFEWVVRNKVAPELPLVTAMKSLREIKDLDQAKAILRSTKLPREAIPTEWLSEPAIWEALLETMPMTAMIRNLGTMGKVGLLTKGFLRGASPAVQKVVANLRDSERIRKARVHPIALLAASNTYAQGAGFRGSGTWTPVKEIVDALDEAFYASYANVQPTGKRILFGLDVSGSMDGTSVVGVAGLTCRSACGAMALLTSAVEESVTHVAFDTKAYELKINGNDRLTDVIRLLERTGGGGTDCAIPIHFALHRRIPVDAFVIYTDSETWYGSEHPSVALERYRNAMGIPAKLVVVAMASTKVSVGNSKDPLTLNVAGFDTAVPGVIAAFLSE